MYHGYVFNCQLAWSSDKLVAVINAGDNGIYLHWMRSDRPLLAMSCASQLCFSVKRQVIYCNNALHVYNSTSRLKLLFILPILLGVWNTLVVLKVSSKLLFCPI